MLKTFSAWVCVTTSREYNVRAARRRLTGRIPTETNEFMYMCDVAKQRKNPVRVIGEQEICQ